MIDIINYLLKHFNIKANLAFNHLLVDNQNNIIGSIWYEKDICYLEIISSYHLKVQIKPQVTKDAYIPGVIDEKITNYEISYEFNDLKNTFIIQNTIIYNIFILNANYYFATFANQTMLNNTLLEDFKNLEDENLLKLKKETNFI